MVQKSESIVRRRGLGQHADLRLGGELLSESPLAAEEAKIFNDLMIFLLSPWLQAFCILNKILRQNSPSANTASATNHDISCAHHNALLAMQVDHHLCILFALSENTTL